MTTHQSDVVIIGAGVSGLAATRVLREHGVSVSLIEARDRIDSGTVHGAIRSGRRAAAQLLRHLGSR
jgi:monoamine oxidase